MYRFLVQLSLIFLMAGCTNVPGHKDEMPSVVCVGDYGAAGDGVTDDTEAIRKALAAAIKAKGAVLKFEPKVYRLKETKNSWFHFEIHNVRDLTIDGCGALLLSEPMNQMFSVKECRNVKIKNLSIDYDPLPYTQGTIESVDPGAGSLVFKVGEGFPKNILDYYYTKGQGRFHGWSHCIVLNPDMKSRNEKTVSDHLYIGDVAKISDDTYNIFVMDSYKDKMGGINAGDGLVIGLGYLNYAPADNLETTRPMSFGRQSCIYINRCNKVTVSGVRIYSTPGRWLRITDNLGPVYILDSKFAPHEDKPNSVSTILDGIHSKNNRKEVIIRGCSFQRSMDDLLNCCQMEEFVSKVYSPTEIDLVNTDHAQTLYSLDAGNELLFIKAKKGKILGSAVIKEVVSTDGRKNRVKLDRQVEGLYAANDKNSEDAVIALNYGRVSSGFEISGNEFVPILRRALAIMWCNGTIKDNVMDCKGGGSIWMVNAAQNFEGPFTRNVVVSGNRIVNSFHPSIYAGAAWAGVASPERFDAGITIENNEIVNQGGNKPAIKIINAKNITLRSNSISVATPGQKDVELINCENIVRE